MVIQVLDGDALFHEAADICFDAAIRAVDERGLFTIALSGGRTPEPLYALLADRYRRSIPWEKTQVFFSDERCVPPGHPESNFNMATRVLLYRIAVRSDNIHRMKGEMDPERAAMEYEWRIRRAFQLDANGVPRFDLIFLGMGEDGHIASLFAGDAAVNEERRLVVAVLEPDDELDRVTLTPPVLLSAYQVVVLVTGQRKSQALRRVFHGRHDPNALPAQLLRDARGQVTWLVDSAAASMLDPTPNAVA